MINHAVELIPKQAVEVIDNQAAELISKQAVEVIDNQVVELISKQAVEVIDNQIVESVSRQVAEVISSQVVEVNFQSARRKNDQEFGGLFCPLFFVTRFLGLMEEKEEIKDA